MDTYKKNIINKIYNINCKNTLNAIFLILKANKIKYIPNGNKVLIDFSQDISKSLLDYINNLISDHNTNDTHINNEKLIEKKLSYDISEYIISDNKLIYNINLFKQKKERKKKQQNSLIYNNIIRLINS